MVCDPLNLWRRRLRYHAIGGKLNENGAPTKHGTRWYHGTVARIDPAAGMVRNRLRRS